MVALNHIQNCFFNFAKSCDLSYLLKVDNLKNITVPYFKAITVIVVVYLIFRIHRSIARRSIY